MKLQRTFVESKLNKDLDERLLPPGQYSHAENIRVANTDASDLGALENVRGNFPLTNFNLTNAVTLGGFADSANEKLYWFTTSDQKDMVVEYDVKNSVTTVLLESTAKTGVLKFDKNYLITGVVKIINGDFKRDLLVWTDDLNPPRMINIERAKTYGLNGFDEDDISVIKLPPRFAPKTQFTYTKTTLENNLENRFVSFAYRYKYLDGEYSALSSFSNYCFAPEKFDLDYQTMENKGMKNRFNAIKIAFDTGSKRVTDIQIVFKESNSNTVFIIETLNKEKENWGNNETKSYTFSNSKKYVALPEDELYRTYDNVPLKAKALELIGNRLVFGNYEEGYDLIDLSGNEIKVNYDVSLRNKVISGLTIPVSFQSTGNNINDLIRIDLTGIKLVEGSRISLGLNIKEAGNRGTFEGNFDFILNKSFDNASFLAADEDFKFFVETIMTNNFTTNYEVTPPANSTSPSTTGFKIVSSTNNSITIKSPVNNYSNDVYRWVFQNNSVVSFDEISINTSLKTNRSYEVGIIYMDKYNRSSTVITDKDNSIYVPQQYSTNQNKIVVNINHTPPVWADRYKLVVKQNKGQYQTVYANMFFEDGLYRWILLEGANKDKVREGDTLIVKSDTDGILTDVVKVRVLEVGTKERDFLKDNSDENSVEIIEPSGLYMKIKPEGFNIEYDSKSFFKVSGFASSFNRPSIRLDHQNFPIKGGARVTVNIESWERNRGDNYWAFKTSIVATQDYANFEQLFNAQIKETKSFKDFNRDNVTSIFQGNVWEIRSRENGYGWNGDRRLSGEITIQNSSLLIFETEPDDTDAEIFYETEQTFNILNNRHTGNIQNQSGTTPATVELDFFNCYVQGNGAESYRYKDAFNSNFLNIDLRPSLTSIEKYKKIRRYADLTYSESYNENNNVNGLNVFNLARANYKEDIDKNYGSIQKLYSRDTDLLVFQEDKVSKVLYGKSLLMNADGSGNVSSIEDVLGQQIAYSGEYGISRNPESFAFSGPYIYFTDARRGTVMRLAGDGLNEVSALGLKQFFKDGFLNSIDNKKIGGYDPYLDEYVLHQSLSETLQNININCSDNFTRNGFTGDLTVFVDAGSIIGTTGFNYKTNGVPVKFTVEWNGNVHHYGYAGESSFNAQLNQLGLPSVSQPSQGNFTFQKTSKTPSKFKVTISAPLPNTRIEFSGICPVSEQGRVFFIVVNQPQYTGRHFLTRFRYSLGDFTSSFKQVEGILGDGRVSVFEAITGPKGVGFVPDNGAQVIMETFYNSQENPIFKTDGRFGYLVSNTVLGENDTNTILSQMTEISKNEILSGFGDKTYRGSFNLPNPYGQNLYLVFDFSKSTPTTLFYSTVSSYDACCDTISEIL